MEVVNGPFGDKSITEVRKALEESKRKLPILLEYSVIEAQLTRSKYLALVKEGFTSQEALDLCKTWRG